MTRSRRLVIAGVVVFLGLFITAGGVFLLLSTLSLREEQQPQLVGLMYDTFWEPEQTAAVLKQAKQDNPFGYRLYRAALRSCLEKTLASAKNESDIVAKSCGPMPSPKCQQDMQRISETMLASLYPLLMLDDPDAFLENPLIKQHQQGLPVLRASRDMGEQLVGAGSNRNLFVQQNLPLVKMLCS